MPLFLVLFGVVLVVSLSPLTFFGRYTVSQMRETLVTSQQERQLNQAGAAAQRIDAFQEQQGREAVKLADALGSLADLDRADPTPVLAGFVDGVVAMVRLSDARGAGSQASVRGLVVPPELESGLEADAKLLVEQADRAPAGGALREAVLGGPYQLGFERRLAVTVSAPVHRRGELIGVFQEVAVFQPVWDEVCASIPPPTRVFLLGPRGTVVARSGEASNGDLSLVNRREIVQQFLGTRGRSRASRSYDVPGPDGSMGRSLGSLASTERGWGVLVEVDEALALAPVRRMIDGIVLGGALAAGLAIFAALLLGGMISRPMARLAAISNRLASGDFSVSAPTSRVREIDELADNYNQMAERLGSLLERLRTAAREANDMFLGTIRALAEAIDEKDPYTKGHSIRVNRFAVIIGGYLGVIGEELRALHVSSLLHDVGKIGIDDAILKKPAALTADEFDVMKSHPERGAKIMGRIPQMKNTVPGMRFHHERWSGGGYPLGLRGEEIPLQARIIAVADTFDAMTTDRPYQRGLPIAQAVAKINDFKGTSLDPQVVEAFNRAFEAGEFDQIIRVRLSAPPEEIEDEPSGELNPPRPGGSGTPAPEVVAAAGRGRL